MNKLNSAEIPLNDQTNFYYFYNENLERKAMRKKLSKYISVFDYIDKTLIILSATSGEISIISFISVNGVPPGLRSASFSLVFSLRPRIIKKLLKMTRENTIESHKH